MENEFQNSESLYAFNSRHDSNNMNVENKLKLQNNKIVSMNKKEKISRDKLEKIRMEINFAIQKGKSKSTNKIEAMVRNNEDKNKIEDKCEYTQDFLRKHRVGNDNSKNDCKIKTSKLQSMKKKIPHLIIPYIIIQWKGSLGHRKINVIRLSSRGNQKLSKEKHHRLQQRRMKLAQHCFNYVKRKRI